MTLVLGIEWMADGATGWSGPMVIAAGVLAAAGIAKLVDPLAARAALSAIGAPVPATVVRAIGGAELVVGLLALVLGGALPGLGVAVAYLGFAVVAWRMSSVQGISSCGCFGGSGGARPGPVHIVVNILLAVGAAGSAATGSGGVVGLVRDTPGGGVPALMGAALAVAGIIALFTTAAETLALTASDPSRSTAFHLVEQP